VENSNPEELKNEIGNLTTLLKDEDIKIVKLFTLWFNNFLTGLREGEADLITERIRNLMEVKTMFEKALEEYAEKYKKIGIEQGIEKGINIGKKEQELIDKQEIVIKQVDRKFTLTEEEKEAIRKVSDIALLDNALDMILFVRTKAEILKHLLDLNSSGS
jgi:hypothetical protein